MLKLSGLNQNQEKEIHVRLVAEFKKEEMNVFANVIQQGLWRFPESSNSKNTFKFGKSQGQYIILENESTLYKLEEQDNGKVKITKLFRTKMKN